MIQKIHELFIILGLVLVLGLPMALTSGCVSKANQTAQPSKQIQSGIKPGNQAGGQPDSQNDNQGVLSGEQRKKGAKTSIPFTTLNLAAAPKELKELADQNRDKVTATGMEFGGRAYLLVTRGVKSSGGYGVEITSVDLAKRAGRPVIEVNVKYTDPAHGRTLTTALTYPMAAVQLNLKTIPYGLIFIYNQEIR